MKPEIPDFEQIAKRLIVLIDPDSVDEDATPIDDLHRRAIANQLAEVVEQVRQIWNARGAADLAVLEPIIEKLGDAMDPDNARTFVLNAVQGSDG